MKHHQRVMNRIDSTFQKQEKVLNIYFTAGYPQLDDTVAIAKALEESQVDMIEIGIPFSDPVADGPTIQESSLEALKNGMTISHLFEQLKTLRETVHVPVLLMGYLNPILQFGIEQFCEQCANVGVDGVIIPDLPMQEYLENYRRLFQDHGIHNIFLISPNTVVDRIREIDEETSGFIYMVSSSSVTGAKKNVDDGQLAYFQKIEDMQLKNPRLIGFGISDRSTYETACEFANGAIIGSAFIQQLKKDASAQAINKFIKRIKG